MNFIAFLGFILHALLICKTCFCWKKDEFRSCDETPFCKQTRSRNPGFCMHIATNISISDGELKARLVLSNSSIPSGDIQVKPLVLTLSIYQDGILRLVVNEDGTLGQTKKRFQVPDVITPDLDTKKIRLRRILQEEIDGDSTPSSVVCLSDNYEVVLRHNPFEVYVREKAGKIRRLSFNSHQLFDFEQLRTKSEGDAWEENFRGHLDTRPHGPQSISFDISFHGANIVAGIPEHATSVALKPTRGPGVDSEPYRLFNLDVFEYLHDSPFGLYGSIPFMMSHGKFGSSGFFWLNAAEMQVDVMEKGWDTESGTPLPTNQDLIDTFWMAEAGIVDGFFFVGHKPKDVLRQYTTVTGKPAMPQLFSIAYHQCRWNYRDEEDVAKVDAKFDENNIPYDVLWLDIEHTDGKKYFTWDKVLFPHPQEMQKKLKAKGRHMVTIVDPHIKRDELFIVHKEATDNSYYVKDAKGNDYDGWCWPGSSSYLDVLNPEIRDWWASKFSLQNYIGSTSSLYIWNDMNEPSVFNGPEVTMPRDSLHHGGIEHRELHNAYGFFFHMATSDGILKRGDRKDRPFVLSRAFFSGSQRFGAVWTGDNTASWEHLRVSVPMLLTLGLAGMPFSGADVGGFFGNPEPELLVRWYQLGAFYPFFRGHAHQDTSRREPWLFGERNTELLREAISVRYMLLPYFYLLFREANVTGAPVMRPLWMEFPSDEKAYKNDEAFMVGNNLFVQGIYTKGAKHVSVYFPGTALWYDLTTGKAYAGGTLNELPVSEESIPTFQRSGSIIPRKDRHRRSTTQMVKDPYTLVIALNSSEAAEGELYIDDGKSFEFLGGCYIHRRFIFENRTLTSINLNPETNNPSQFFSENVIERIILLGLTDKLHSAIIQPENRRVDIEFGPLRMQKGHNVMVPTIRKPGVKVAEDWKIIVV